MKTLLVLLLLITACAPRRYYLDTKVVDKSDSIRFHLKRVSIEVLKPGTLRVGDTIRIIRTGRGPGF